MSKFMDGAAARWHFIKFALFGGWRWVVFVVWSVPYGIVSLYDLAKGQEYVSADVPAVSSIIPLWVTWTWLAIGVLLLVVVTIEGAYRYTRQVQAKADAELIGVRKERDVALSHKGDEQHQKRIRTELENRRRICEPIQDILPKLSDRITLLVSEVDALIDDDVLKKALQKATEYAEQHLNPSGESHDEFLRELRHGLDRYDIGINSLVQNDKQASDLSVDLQSQRSELSHPVLNQHIRNYQRVLYDSSSARLLAKYATGGQLRRVANFMRTEEDTSERLIRIMVEINRLIAKYMMGNDIL